MYWHGTIPFAYGGPFDPGAIRSGSGVEEARIGPNGRPIVAKSQKDKLEQMRFDAIPVGVYTEEELTPEPPSPWSTVAKVAFAGALIAGGYFAYRAWRK